MVSVAPQDYQRASHRQEQKYSVSAEDDKRAKMRQSDEYQAMLKKNIDWLNYLDSTDSDPNNGRVDVSVFNAEVAQYGYNATPDILGYRKNNHGIRPCSTIYSDDVDINKQAQSMTDQYYAKKFGL